MSSVTIKGLDEVYKILEELPDSIQGEVFQKIAREIGAKEVIPAVKSSLPYSPETESHIKVANEGNRSTAVLVAPTYKAFFLRFLEFGTTLRKTNKGFNRGSISSRPFLQRAYEDSIDKVSKYLSEKLADRMTTFINKAKKKL